MSLTELAIGKGHVHIGDPHIWALGVVAFAALAQLTVAQAFGQAAVLSPEQSARAHAAVGRGASVALLLWLAMSAALELFVTYEAVGWEKFVLLSLLAAATWALSR